MDPDARLAGCLIIISESVNNYMGFLVAGGNMEMTVCGGVTKINGEQEVLVGGGYNFDEGGFDDSYIFNMDTLDWRQGPNLPYVS